MVYSVLTKKSTPFDPIRLFFNRVSLIGDVGLRLLNKHPQILTDFACLASDPIMPIRKELF